MENSPWSRVICCMATERKNTMKLLPNLQRLSQLVIALALCASGSAEKAPPAKLPVTTSSSEAAQYFEAGMVNYENHKWNLAVDPGTGRSRLIPSSRRPMYGLVSLRAIPLKKVVIGKRRNP